MVRTWLIALGIFLFQNFFLTAGYAGNLNSFSDFFICELATDERGTSRAWSADHNMRKYIDEAQKRRLNCLSDNIKTANRSQDKNNTVSHIRNEFLSLEKFKRKKIQINLKHLDMYEGKIDALYGLQTLDGLKAYSKKFLQITEIKNSHDAKRVIKHVLSLEIPQNSIDGIDPEQGFDPVAPENKIFNVSSGTGFFVSHQGHIITNHHVVEGCQKIIIHKNGQSLESKKIAADRINDLALLKISEQPKHIFSFRRESIYELLDIVVAGFPFGEDISSSLKFTRGVVSALSGIGNNYSEIQIDAALQPGNSGGPIMDDLGNIVGIAVAQLDTKAILENYGVIPENTNFGIKSSVALSLMEANRITSKPPNTIPISKKELSQLATSGTVLLSCWMTIAQVNKMKQRKAMFERFK
jgi:S1-C subfamily serine protease